MADTRVETQEQLLRHRVSDFVGKQTQRRRPMQSALEHVSTNQWSAYLFGGVARDLLQRGLKAEVRDVDIVLDGGVFPQVEQTMAAYLKRRTRFGGLHLEHQGWLFDMWSLGSTWAFCEGFVSGADFADLPKTTFLNVEAIVVELNSNRGCRKVYSHGFFEAFLNRVVEINLEENPYPALCVVRSLLTACRLNFAMGPRLVKYITHYSRCIDVDEMLEIQRSHYGRVVLNAELLTNWFTAVDEQYRTDRQGNVRLPSCSEQLTLLHYDVAPQSPEPPQARLATLYTAYIAATYERNERVRSLAELRRKQRCRHLNVCNAKQTSCSAKETGQLNLHKWLSDVPKPTDQGNSALKD